MPARSIASRNVRWLRIGCVCGKQPALFGDRLFEIAGDRGGRCAVLLADKRGDPGLSPAILEPDQLAIERNLARDQRVGLFDQPLLGRDCP